MFRKFIRWSNLATPERQTTQSSSIEPSAWYLPLVLLLLAPGITQTVVSKSASATIGLLFQLLILGALFYTFNWSRWLAGLLSVCVVIASIDTLYFLEYREGVSVRALAIAFQTPPDQSVSFLIARLPVIAATFLLSCLICFMVYKAPSPEIRTGQTAKWIRRIATVLSLLFFALVGFATLQTLDISGSFANNFTRFVASNVANSYPYKPIQSWLGYHVSNRNYNEFQTRKTNLDLTSKVKITRSENAEDLAEALVLVLGESSNRSRWGLYGYNRDTTPNLSKRVGLHLVDDMVTPWNSTMASIPVIMTQKKPTDKELYTDQPGLTKILDTAGFETFWISNQGHSGNFDRSIKQLYTEAKHQAFVGGATALLIGQNGDDARLLEPIQKALATNVKRVFIVVHTQGSHYPFWERHPASFEKFVPAKRSEDFFNNRLRNKDWLEVSNSYDNSILYTDYVLDQIIETLIKSGRRARLLYLSDHGQSIPSASCSELGQGYTSENNLRVPAFVWLSDSYARKIGPNIEHFKRNAKLPMSTTNIFPTVLDLAGVTLEGAAVNSSIFAETFKAGAQVVNIQKTSQLFTSIPLDSNCR
jgi:glucan phosphoethanolaminetransferase (alkaline phosphatase superfamily)